MHRIIGLGSTPRGEPSAKEGWDDYKLMRTLECRVLRDMVLRTLGPEPSGCYLTIRDLQLVLVVLEEQDDVSEYIERLSDGIPTVWDQRALGHLGRGLQRFGLLAWEVADDDLTGAAKNLYESV